MWRLSCQTKRASVKHFLIGFPERYRDTTITLLSAIVLLSRNEMLFVVQSKIKSNVLVKSNTFYIV